MPRPDDIARTGFIGSLNCTVGETVTATLPLPSAGVKTTVGDGTDRSALTPVVNNDVAVGIRLPATSLIPAIEIVCTVLAAMSPVKVIVSVRLAFDSVRAATGNGFPPTRTLT